MKKITKNEFNDWAKELNNFLWVEIGKIPEGEEHEKAIEFTSFFYLHIKLENTLALASLVDVLQKNFDAYSSEFRIRKWTGLGNRTYEEWLDYLVQRINEHHQTRINYQPDLTTLKSRRQKIKGWWKDEDFCSRLFGQIAKDKEAYDLIWNIKKFFEESEKKMPSDKSETPEEFLRKFIYLFEDYSKIVEQAKDKLEQEKSPNSPKRNQIPNSAEEKDYRISKLEQEKSQLESQKKELEQKLANQELSSDERKGKEKELNDIRDLLEENEKKQKKLLGEKERKNSQNSPKNDGKINLAIGLGITAVLIGLICLILLASRRRER